MGGRVLVLLQDVEIGPNMPLFKGQELEVVANVIYINGNPVPPDLQGVFINWLNKNPTLYKDDTRTW